MKVKKKIESYYQLKIVIEHIGEDKSREIKSYD